MINDGDCITIFNSIHRVMQAEKVLKANELKVLLIPVPRQLSSDCGLAIRFAEPLRAEVETALNEAGLQIAELWLKQAGDYVPLQQK